MSIISKTLSSKLGTLGSLISAIAPNIATALGGPLAGLAVRTISSVLLGKEDGSLDDIKAVIEGGGHDKLAQLKKIDADFAAQMKKLDIDLEKISYQDRDSARKMQIATRDWIPRALALGVTVGFFSILGILAFKGLPVSGNEAFLILLGALATSFTSIISFYYGSSSGSKTKEKILENLSEK